MERLRNLVSGKRTERKVRTGDEIAWGGAKVFSGIVLDEYNPDLKGRLVGRGPRAAATTTE